MNRASMVALVDRRINQIATNLRSVAPSGIIVKVDFDVAVYGACAASVTLVDMRDEDGAVWVIAVMGLGAMLVDLHAEHYPWVNLELNALAELNGWLRGGKSVAMAKAAHRRN